MKGADARQRVGSKEQVTNILGYIAQQRETALTRGEKDRVTKKLYLMAAQNPDSSLWAVDKPPTVRVVDPMTKTVRAMVDPNYRNLSHVVMLRIGGKDAAITFNERNPEALRLAQSIKNLDVGDLHAAIRHGGPQLTEMTRMIALAKQDVRSQKQWVMTKRLTIDNALEKLDRDFRKYVR